jgi:hypothetical protein
MEENSRGRKMWGENDVVEVSVRRIEEWGRKIMRDGRVGRLSGG